MGNTSSAANHYLLTESAGGVAVWDDARDGGRSIYFNMTLGTQPYGQGTTGFGGYVPSLVYLRPPVRGQTASFTLSNGRGGAVGAWLFGGPGQKASLPVLGGTLLLVPSFSIPLQLGSTPGLAGAGQLQLDVPIPPDASYAGVQILLQAVMLDSGAPAGVSMSNALEFWIG